MAFLLLQLSWFARRGWAAFAGFPPLQGRGATARSHLEIDADYSAPSPAAHEKMDGQSIQESEELKQSTISSAPL
jgi:hypothetical protein